MVITAPEFMDKVSAAREKSEGVQHVIVVSPDSVEGAFNDARLLLEHSDVLDIHPTADDDVAALVYTSGTTGKPKGVMQTHDALYFTAVNLQATTEYPPETVTVAMLPLCHSYGIGLMNTALLRTMGKTVVLRQFNLEQLFASSKKYKVNSVAAVPTIYIRNGWLHTGDIGYIDGDGYYYITDRKKDIIIKGAENISLPAIQEVLYAHPAVSEAAVIGVQDKVYGEELKAFVVLKPGRTAAPEEIIEYCGRRLKRFFAPGEVVMIPAMPKSLVGKILKKELRKM